VELWQRSGWNWRKPFLQGGRRWILFHLLAGVLGSAAILPDMWAGPGDGFLVDPPAGPDDEAAALARPGSLLLLAALPTILYQAWELAPAPRSIAWIGATFGALLLAPFLAVPVLLVILVLGSPLFALLGGDAILGPILAAVAFVIGSLWLAPVQWLVVRKQVSFLKWWRTVGPTAGLAAILVLLGYFFSGSSVIGIRVAWNLAIPLATVLYALGTLPVISGLLQPKAGPWTRTAPTL
jgi:hypothetical protein